jgi:hypothetical protein
MCRRRAKSRRRSLWTALPLAPIRPLLVVHAGRVPSRAHETPRLKEPKADGSIRRRGSPAYPGRRPVDRPHAQAACCHRGLQRWPLLCLPPSLGCGLWAARAGLRARQAAACMRARTATAGRVRHMHARASGAQGPGTGREGKGRGRTAGAAGRHRACMRRAAGELDRCARPWYVSWARRPVQVHHAISSCNDASEASVACAWRNRLINLAGAWGPGSAVAQLACMLRAM